MAQQEESRVSPHQVIPSKEWDKIDASRKCMHCGASFIGRCPSCLRFVCQNQNCTAIHEIKCVPIKIEENKG